MTVELWMGGEFDTTYEREALDAFMDDMESRFGQLEDLYLVLADYYIKGRQVDLTVLKRDGIIIVELKECLEPFKASENGDWLTPSGHLLGSRDFNPYQQVWQYRGKWADFLRDNQGQFRCLANIQGGRPFWSRRSVVAVGPSLHPDTENAIETWWFKLCGLDELSKLVGTHTNRYLDFSDEELRFLVSELLSLTGPTMLALDDNNDQKDPDDKEGPEASIMCSPVAPIFAHNGPIANALGERYHPRSGQLEMAQLIKEALQERKHAVIEAGTGSGKSFAYLVPIIWSGARAIISTSNKALMAQLWHKDIPFLRKVVMEPFQAALLKGRSNYICVSRWNSFRKNLQLPEMVEEGSTYNQIQLVEEGLRYVPSGDCEEMRLPFDLIKKLTINYGECEGRTCNQFGVCFYERAKAEALEADIIVTNHALLCYSVLGTGNKLLPIRPVLVIDEAHQLEAYAIDALTLWLEYDSIWSVVNHGLAKQFVDEDFHWQVVEKNMAFFNAVDNQRPAPKQDKWILEGEIQEGVALWDSLRYVRDKLQRLAVRDEALQGQLDSLAYRAKKLVQTVYALAYPAKENHIRYCELSADKPMQGYAAYQIHNCPLDVSGALERHLFKAWPRVICTSATLGVNQDLSWFQDRTGIKTNGSPVGTGIIPSPFNFAENVLLYTPRGFTPTYGEDQETYEAKLEQEVQRLVNASRGRAFVLCTSRASMMRLYERLKPKLTYPCYCQGVGTSRRELVEQFEDSGEAVLFATRSFWEGVDIPGKALSLVILDKIPFLYADDPVFKEQEKLVKARGGDPFEELQLGNAILTLRQGAGRLVRSEHDRGVIALLDSRIHTKYYGKKIVQSLPDAKQVTDFTDVQAFFASH